MPAVMSQVRDGCLHLTSLQWHPWSNGSISCGATPCCFRTIRIALMVRQLVLCSCIADPFGEQWKVGNVAVDLHASRIRAAQWQRVCASGRLRGRGWTNLPTAQHSQVEAGLMPV